MTDKELLEFSAKSVGIVLKKYCPASDSNHEFFIAYLPVEGRERDYPDYSSEEAWNPLIYDGDAYRIAVKLKMSVNIYSDETIVTADGVFLNEYHYSNPYAATRRAIVRASAEIGKSLS